MVEEGLDATDSIYNACGQLLLQAATRVEETKRGIWSSECTSAQEGCVIKGNYIKVQRTDVSPALLLQLYLNQHQPQRELPLVLY